MNKLIKGDCYEVIKNIPDKSIDLIVTDPPYKYKNVGGDFIQKIIQRKENIWTT